MLEYNRSFDSNLIKKEFDECVNINKNLKIIYITINEEEEEKQFSNIPSTNEWKGEYTN